MSSKTFNPFKDLNLTKCREVLLKYSLLITHEGMPFQIWHQLRERLTDLFFQIINSLIESFGVKFTCLGCKHWILYVLLFYLQYWPVQTGAPASGAVNIGNFSCLFQTAEIQIPVNKYECPQRLSFSLGNLFWDSFTNHNTVNYLHHGINITTNQRLSPKFQGNGNTIIISDSQTSPLLIFPEGGGHLYTGYSFLSVKTIKICKIAGWQNLIEPHIVSKIFLVLKENLSKFSASVAMLL